MKIKFQTYKILNFLLLSSLFVLASSQFQIFAQPKIKMLKTEKNWGDVNYQHTLSEEIKFINIGDDTLKIIDIRPGCGCTVVPSYSSQVAPGDTGSISIKLNVKTYTGQITKSVNIFTTDPSSAHVTYLLKCNVIRPFVIIPRYISFDKLYVGQEGTANTIIKNTSNIDATIKNIETSSNLLELNIKEGDIIKSGESMTITTKVVPKEKGHIRETIKLILDHPDEEFIELSAYGRAIIKN